LPRLGQKQKCYKMMLIKSFINFDKLIEREWIITFNDLLEVLRLLLTYPGEKHNA